MDLDKTPTKSPSTEQEVWGRSFRKKIPKLLFSPNTASGRENKKQNAKNLKRKIKDDRKAVNKAERQVLEQLDVENSEFMLNEEENESPCVKLKDVRNKRIIVKDMSTQTDESFESLQNKDIEIAALKEKVRSLESAPLNAEDDMSFKNDVISKLNDLSDGMSKLLSQQKDTVVERHEENELMTEIAGVQINKACLQEAKHSLKLEDSLKCIILGYWKPSDYKFVASRKPPGVEDKDFVRLTTSHYNDIFKIAKKLQENTDLPISKQNLEQWTFENMKVLIQNTLKAKRASDVKKQNKELANTEHGD